MEELMLHRRHDYCYQPRCCSVSSTSGWLRCLLLSQQPAATALKQTSSSSSSFDTNDSISSSGSSRASSTPSLSPSPHEQQQQQNESKDVEKKKKKCYVVKVSYEGRTCEISVDVGESVLNAMERSSKDVARQLGLSGLPSDCRRGSCMTCSAVHNSDSRTQNLTQRGDSLTPATSRRVLASAASADTTATPSSVEAASVLANVNHDENRQEDKRRFVLTCSSYVEGDGVHLELGKCDSAWIEAYRTGIESDEETQRIARESVARAIRKGAERNVAAWKARTEEVLRRTPSSPSE